MSLKSTSLSCLRIAQSVINEPPRKSGAELLFRCPRHDDQRPSLSVNTAKNVWMCGPCGKGGTGWQLAAFLFDLSPDDKRGVTERLRERGLLNSSRKVVATYDYTDESGKLLFQVVRYQPKDFRQRRPDGKGGWSWDLEGVRRVLYRLPDLTAAQDVLILEGEKDADRARSLGFSATCNSGGAGKWQPEYSESLRGKRVCSIADADESGRKHARDVATSFVGKAESVKMLELPGAKDLSEWLERGGTAKALRSLIDAAPEWKPRNLKLGALLDSLAAYIRRFVFLSEAQVGVVALWVAHTHAFEAADTTPYLDINSPEKRSGKTRLEEVLETLVFNPWLTGRVTAAVLTRKVDAESPTLLLDESDAAFGGEKEYAEALRGILNTGHRRGGKASCCVGQGASISYKDFSTFCPKAIAGIGKLPPTVADRSIPIRLKRVAPGERVERFRVREVKGEAEGLKTDVAAWAEVNIEQLREARPELPTELNDRQQDGAEPLLAIADAAGGEWSQKARRALIELCAEGRGGDDSIGVRLLADIQEILTESEKKEKRKRERIASAELVDALREIEDSPWGEWSKGKPLTTHGLARLLRPFGILPRLTRENGVFRGYFRDDFADAFSRYPRLQTVQPLQGNIDAAPSDFQSVTPVTIRKSETTTKNAGCNGVTLEKGGTGETEVETASSAPRIFFAEDEEVSV